MIPFAVHILNSDCILLDNYTEMHIMKLTRCTIRFTCAPISNEIEKNAHG